MEAPKEQQTAWLTGASWDSKKDPQRADSMVDHWALKMADLKDEQKAAQTAPHWAEKWGVKPVVQTGCPTEQCLAVRKVCR